MTAAPVVAADTRRITDWLAAIATSHDFTLGGPGGTEEVAITVLLDAFSAEFAAYRDIVVGARDAAGGNAASLGAIVRATKDQERLIRTAAHAATESGRRASAMVDDAGTLTELTRAADDAAADAETKLAAIAAVLGSLADGLVACGVPLIDMARLTAQITDFPATLARLSRHAQLLGVNASIEAAHLADAGARLGLVAAEVRNLASSTASSQVDVAHIIRDLRTSIGQVEQAMRASHDATAGTTREICGARESVARIGAGIERLEAKVGTVVGVAETQSTAVVAINASVSQIAAAAAVAADTANDAAVLDLETLLDRAAERAVRWNVRSGQAQSARIAGPFAAWISAIACGADPADDAVLADCAELAPLVRAVRALIDRVNAEQREILGDVVKVAVAVARNGYAWIAIDAAQANISSELVTVRDTLVTAVDAARTSAQISLEMSGVVADIRQQYDAVVQLLEGALALVVRIGGSVNGIVGFVESMTLAAARADAIMDLLETLSSQTGLLSLNAAIEAAHAGELGLAFGVIAEEIRKLAGSTNESTTSVSRLLPQIAGENATLRNRIATAGDLTSEIIDVAQAARRTFETLQSTFESAEARARNVAANAAAQTSALENARETIDRSSTTTDDKAAEHTARCRLDLALLGCSAHAIAGRRPIGTVVSRIRVRLATLCVSIEDAIEATVVANRITPSRLFDFRYVPVDGSTIASLGRLFDVSRVPSQGFNPPKYTTPWDTAIDESIIGVLSDAWLSFCAEPIGAVSLVVCDLNGFLWAYPRTQIAAWTNDPAHDTAGNRIKRILEDPYTLRVARTGLGEGAATLGPRQSFEAFGRAGCALETAVDRPWGAYVYARDTSAVYTDVALAIYVRGKRFGTLRFIYDPNVI